MVSCGKNEIKRKGYYRKKNDGTTVKKTYVPPACIKDRGEKGKGPDLIGKLQKGKLSKYGYSSAGTPDERHKALKKAVKNYGYADVVRKLNAISILNKNTNPSIAKKFLDDMHWVQQNF